MSSYRTVTRTFTAAEFNALQQKIYLSFLGMEMWRMYRADGLHPSLLIEMHPWNYDPDMLYDTLCATLARFITSPAYTPTFKHRVTTVLHADHGQWTGSGFGKFGLYWREEKGNWVVRGDHVLPGIDLDDDEEFELAVLAAGVGAYLYTDAQHDRNAFTEDHTRAVHATLAPLWFELCDAVLALNAAEEAAT